MIRRERSQVIHLAIDNDPAIVRLSMLREFLHRHLWLTHYVKYSVYPFSVCSHGNEEGRT